MTANTSSFAEGESPMTDLQFSAYVELRDKYEALLELRLAPPQKEEDAVSDYQFKRYEQLRDKCEKQTLEIDQLRKDNTSLRMQVEMLKANTKRIRF